jgi:hypothetical protein
MPGIPREVTEHSLDIRAGARPVKQSLHRFDEGKCRAIGEEVHKLLVAPRQGRSSATGSACQVVRFTG